MDTFALPIFAPAAGRCRAAQARRTLLVGCQADSERRLRRILRRLGIKLVLAQPDSMAALRFMAEPDVRFDNVICGAEMSDAEIHRFIRFGAMFDVGQFIFSSRTVGAPAAYDLGMQGYRIPRVACLQAPWGARALAPWLAAH
jgi:hypothetical protein